MKEISLGGARGLEVISLLECRNLEDGGINYLTKCLYLKKVILLGCLLIKDSGVIPLAKELRHLEDIDIGGTMITHVSLKELVTNCKKLKSVNITSCKKIYSHDHMILKTNSINGESGDDIFRFYLTPLPYSELPKITQSVLKTRSTLSLFRVQKYLLKKFAERNVEEQFGAIHDWHLEILCNGTVLSPHI
jgi:hypothetical protein